MTALPGRKGKGTASRRARREGTLLWDFTASALMIIADDCAGCVCAGMVPALDLCCICRLCRLTTLPQFNALENASPERRMSFHPDCFNSCKPPRFWLRTYSTEAWSLVRFLAMALTSPTVSGGPTVLRGR
jgi:hypothetical protein